MPKQFDLTTLGLGTGEYSIQVKAKASGYKDSPLSNSVQYTVAQQGWTFGVSGLTNSSPTLTRTDDSVGYTWTKNSTSGIITTDFDTIFNFEEVTDSNGNVFIRIPKMYYKRTADTIQLSDHSQTGFACHPLFLNESGQEMNYFDVGKYKGSYSNSELHSYVNVTASGHLDIAMCREGARENNDYDSAAYQYQIGDLRYLSWLWMFWMVVFATRQTEDVMGTTWYEYTNATTGNTNNLVNNNLTYPKSICGQDPTTHSFKLFGIEDVVGAGQEFVDGVTFLNSNICYSLQPSKYVNSATSSTTGYQQLSYARAVDTNYIVSIGLDANQPAIMLPSYASGGSASTYFCDFTAYSSGTKMLYFGAALFNIIYGVFFCSSDSFSISLDANRSRLMRQLRG